MDTKFVLMTAAVCLSLTCAQQQSPQQQSYPQNYQQNYPRNDQQNYAQNYDYINYIRQRPALEHNFNTYPDGSYAFNYLTADGSARAESGQFRKISKQLDPALAVEGSYSYFAPLGEHVRVNYAADENGFRPRWRITSLYLQRSAEDQVGNAKAAPPAYRGKQR